MKLIIGGAYQGKLSYAKREFGITDGWIDGENCELMDITTCRGIRHFHLYVRKLLERERKELFFSDGMMPFHFLKGDLTYLEQQADAFAEWLCEKNPEIVITSNEVGCGIVPVDEDERAWREVVGRISTSLAERADTVIRVISGVGMRMK